MSGEAAQELFINPELSSPKIVRLGKASVEMGELIRKNCISERNINPANIPTAEIICRGDIDLNSEAGLEEVLNKAAKRRPKQKELRIGFYNSGISKGVEGDAIEKRQPVTWEESLKTRVGEVIERGMRAQIIPEEKFENKETAADFLIEEGLDIVIMVVPQPDNIYSSLAADAVSRGTVLGKLRESAITPEIYAFSDGGFKEFQIHFACFTAIIDDLRYAVKRGMISDAVNIDTATLEEVLSKVKKERQEIQGFDQPDHQDAGKREHLWKKTFTNGLDAIRYLSAQNGADIIIGSAPADVYELAIIPLFHPQLIRRFAQSIARMAVNKSIQTLAHNEHRYAVDTILSGNYFSGNIELFISRLLEIGRARSPKERDIIFDDLATRLTRRIMSEKLGKGKIVYLADRSGDAVDTADGGIIHGESLFFEGGHTLFVETHPELDLCKEKQGDIVPAVHEEMKRDGAVAAMHSFAASEKLGLLSDDDTSGVRIVGRYIPTTGEIIGIDQNGAALRKPCTFILDRYNQLLEIRTSLSEDEQKWLSQVERAFSDKLIDVDLKPTALDTSEALPMIEGVTQKIVEVMVDGKPVRVVYKFKDYRKVENRQPDGRVNIFCQSYHPGRNGSLNRFETLQCKEAEKMGACWIAVGILDIPPAYDQKSDRVKPPELDVDARIVLKAMQQEGINPLGPVIISGHSEGAGVALALADEVNNLQQAHAAVDGDYILPENILRNWSFTGVIELKGIVTGAKLAIGGSKELMVTELLKTVSKYERVTGIDVPSITDINGLLIFVRDYLVAYSKYPELREKEKASSADEDIARGQGRFIDFSSPQALGRSLSRLPRIIAQLAKIEQRNDACEHLGKNWQVVFTVPRRDAIYGWRVVDDTIRLMRRRFSADVGKIVDRISVGQSTLERNMQLLFPHAKAVRVRVLGNRGVEVAEGESPLHHHTATDTVPDEVMDGAGDLGEFL